MKICREGFYSIFNVYFSVGDKVPIWYVGLYTNTIEPVITSNLSNITELVAAGYTRKQIDSWTIVNSTRAWANASNTTWNVGSSTWNNVNGYFITNVSSGTSGLLLAVCQFPTTKTLTNETLLVIINFTHSL